MIKSKRTTRNGYEVFFTGTITSDEMFEIGSDFKQHPDFTSLDYVLMSFKDINNMLIPNEEVEQLARRDILASVINPSIRFTVATDSPLVFGLARMWEAYYSGGPWEAMVFNDFDEALL